MLAVFEREFKSLFRNIVAIVAATLFLIASGVLFLVNNVISGYPYMHAVFSNMTLVTAILIPSVAACVITSERKIGGDAFLAMLPVTAMDVVVGKFLAVFCFFMIPTAVLAIYPIVLLMIGGGAFFQSYAILLMLIFAEAFFIALCVMISACCRKSWSSLLISYVILAILFVLGMISVLFGAGVKQVLYFVSPFRHFDPVVFDLFDISSVIFYVSFTFLFLFVAILCIRGRERGKAPHTASRKRVLTAVLAFAVLCVNVGMTFIPSVWRQVDISNNKLYAISDATKDFLDKLDDEITIYLIDPSSAEEKLHSYIRRYCERSDKITLKEVDTTKDAEFLERYKISSVSLYSMIVESKKTGRYKLVTSDEYFSYSYENGEMTPSKYKQALQQYGQLYEYYMQLYSDNQASADDVAKVEEYLYSLYTETTLCIKADEAITTAIEYVNAPYVPSIRFMTGHDEKNSENNPIDAETLKNMTVSEAQLTLLIVNDPEYDYSDFEISAIQGFSDKGGRLLVITDDSIYSMTNVKKLLACFGLSPEECVVSADGSTVVDATVNGASDVMENSSLTTLQLSGASSIISVKVGELAFSPLLTVSVPIENNEESDNSASDDGEADEEDTVDKTVAISVTDGGEQKLVWLTGADTFNRDRTDMTDEQKTEYAKAKSLVQSASLWLWTDFPYSIDSQDAKTYSPLAIEVNSSAGAWIVTVFIVLMPLALFGGAWMRLYSRRKHSRAVRSAE